MVREILTRVLPRLAGALLTLLLFRVTLAHAAWPYDPYVGGLPVATQAGFQDSPAVVSDGAGGVIVVWQDERSGAGDLYAQRVDAGGNARWTAGGVAICTATGDQYGPAIVSDGAGGAIIAWTDGRVAANDVYAQRISAAGVVQWAANGVVVCNAAGVQLEPAATSDDAGGAVLVWEDRRNGNSDVFAQRLAPNGTVSWAANGVGICVGSGEQIRPCIVGDDVHGAYFAWEDGRGATPDVYAQRVNDNGSAWWAFNGVAVCTGAGSPTELRLIRDALGGAIVAWTDDRSGAANLDVYAQRLAPTGAGSWTVNGFAVCASPGNQYEPAIAPDEMGGAWMAWTDGRNAGQIELGFQHVLANGGVTGLTNGSVLFNLPGTQDSPVMVPDGLGGAFLGWQDQRGGISRDLYVTRVSRLGTSLWTQLGTLLCGAPLAQRDLALVADGRGAVLTAWADLRSGSGTSDLYAQRVDMGGELGDAAPRITSVRDVRNDQGGFVRVAFAPSYLDVTRPAPDRRQYSLWRSVPTRGAAGARAIRAREVTNDPREALAKGMLLAGATADYAWEPTDLWANPRGQSEYAWVVPTTSDSMAGSNPRTAYMVWYADWDNDRWWTSAPDSGYSVDNLGPATPAAFAAVRGDDGVRLSWQPNAESDLAGYRLYRGAAGGFVADASTLVATLTGVEHVDLEVGAFAYQLEAVDTHGNASPAASVVLPGANPTPAPIATLSFAAPAPNPTSGATTLRWALPAAGRARLAVFDAAGRRVRTLHDADTAAGEHASRFDLRDDAGRALPAGVYLARFDAAGATLTRRLLVLP